MQHHYLVTEDIPEIVELGRNIPSVTDLDGYTYMRQERKGLLLGVYELNPKIWNLQGVPWDYRMDLIPEEFDRIAPELNKGFERFPVLHRTGIRRWVNGAFTFTPDGNPLVGPVPGLRNYWVACGVMAGFSQGGGVGLSLAQWMVNGEPEADVYGMDIARYGEFSSEDKYLADTTRQFYAKRFVMTYPNEELPAGRPLKLSKIHNRLESEGAQFGCLWGLEVPLYFASNQPDFQETPTLRRSNAFELVEREVNAVRSTVGIIDITGFSRYEVSGSGAEAWLDRLLGYRLPGIDGIRLAPMLAHSGRLAGDLTVMRLDCDRFWLMGSYYLQAWHMRWFEHQLPQNGVRAINLSDAWSGVSISGPDSRNLLSALVRDDVSTEAFPIMNCRWLQIGECKALVGRLAVTGELGYEINVPAENLFNLYETIEKFRYEYSVTSFGFRAMNSLRLEKAFGAWSTEYTSAYTPGMSGLDRFIAFDKGEFIGREVALKERDHFPEQRLALLEIDARDADVSGFEPVWSDARRVGFITSGGYGHWTRKSLGMGYIDREFLERPQELSVHVVGEERSARILTAPPHDPSGSRMRS